MAKENEITSQKGVIDQQDLRIRTMELNECDDLAEYNKAGKLNANAIES